MLYLYLRLRCNAKEINFAVAHDVCASTRLATAHIVKNIETEVQLIYKKVHCQIVWQCFRWSPQQTHRNKKCVLARRTVSEHLDHLRVVGCANAHSNRRKRTVPR